MSRAVILLNANYDAKREFRPYLIPAYTDAVRRAGGIPLIVPYQSSDTNIERVLDCGGALLITGGADIDPTHYGEARHARTKVKYEKAPPRPHRAGDAASQDSKGGGNNGKQLTPPGNQKGGRECACLCALCRG